MLVSQGEVADLDLDILLMFPVTPDIVSPVDFLSNNNWGAIKALSQMEVFR